MQISVDLQDMFSYQFYMIIIVSLLIIGVTIYIFTSKNKGKVKLDIKEINKQDKNSIQNKYIEKLNNLEQKVKNNEITTRFAYQELSQDIRNFVYEMTGIKVQSYTLKEIKKASIPILYELIKEFYTPEFARRFLGDIESSIDKTRKVIEKWN